MTERYYAGIGSRETPISLKKAIIKIAKLAESKGYILRSGAADGADMWFEEGVSNPKNKEIYLPWAGFNGHQTGIVQYSPLAETIAKKFHPAWDNLKRGGKSMMIRNSYQILGLDCKSPVEFVVCWTEGGKMKGGTSQAMRIAIANNIPIYNLYHKEDIVKLVKYLFKQSTTK